MIKYFPIVGIIALGACEITNSQIEFSHSQNNDSDEVTQIASVVVPTPDPSPAPAPEPDEPALDMSQSVSELLQGVTDQEQVEQILQDKIEHQESEGKRRKQR